MAFPQVVFRDTVETHIRDECVKTVIECEYGCGKSLKRDEWKSHSEKYCPFRKQPCALCGDILDYKIVYKHSTRLCPLREVPCSRGCGETMKAVELQSHENFVCELRPTPCRCGLEYDFVYSGDHRLSLRFGGTSCTRFSVFAGFRWRSSKSTRKTIAWIALSIVRGNAGRNFKRSTSIAT